MNTRCHRPTVSLWKADKLSIRINRIDAETKFVIAASMVYGFVFMVKTFVIGPA